MGSKYFLSSPACESVSLTGMCKTSTPPNLRVASSRTARHTEGGKREGRRREGGSDVGDGGRGRGWEMEGRGVMDELRGI